MGDVTDMKGWISKKEEALLDKEAEAFCQLAKFVAENANPQLYADNLAERVARYSYANDDDSLTQIVCFLEVLRLVAEDFYIDLVCTPGYEEKVVKPLTAFISRRGKHHD